MRLQQPLAHLGSENGANEVVVEEGAESVVDHATRFEYNVACFLETFVNNDVISGASDIRNQRYRYRCHACAERKKFLQSK